MTMKTIFLIYLIASIFVSSEDSIYPRYKKTCYNKFCDLITTATGRVLCLGQPYNKHEVEYFYDSDSNSQSEQMKYSVIDDAGYFTIDSRFTQEATFTIRNECNKTGENDYNDVTFNMPTQLEVNGGSKVDVIKNYGTIELSLAMFQGENRTEVTIEKYPS